MFAANSVDKARVEKLQRSIKKLLTSALQDLYVQQIKASSNDENTSTSGLGFPTMINDYDARLGWKFESLSTTPDIITVTVTAQIKV